MNLSPRLVLLTFSLAVACGIPSETCDRSGCEAVAQPAPATIDRGIAGAVASPSDLGINGCTRCSFAPAQLTVYTAEQPVVDEATAKQVFDAAMIAAVISANGRYEQALASGEYLICLDRGGVSYCTGLTVPDLGVISVHVILPLGSPLLIVFLPGATQSEQPRLYALMR